MCCTHFDAGERGLCRRAAALATQCELYDRRKAGHSRADAERPETLVWTNITTAATRELQFHLYYNAWRNHDSTWMREHALTSWWQSAGSRRDEDLAAIDISSLRLTAGAIAPVDLTKQMRFISPDDGNEDDRTVMAVTLPEPIGPGETITLDIAFTAKIPRPFARTGAIGNFFFIAQWFPKIGVLDAAGRWNCHQFHVATEFFADFGVSRRPHDRSARMAACGHGPPARAHR